LTGGQRLSKHVKKMIDYATVLSILPYCGGCRESS